MFKQYLESEFLEEKGTQIHLISVKKKGAVAKRTICKK